jgi:hypothetical protein
VLRSSQPNTLLETVIRITELLLIRSPLGSGDGYAGVVYVHNSPLTVFTMVDLGFRALRMKRAAIPPDLRNKIPVELRPCSIAIHMNSDIFWRELSLRECTAHQVPVHIRLDLFATMFFTSRVNERHVWRVREQFIR